MLLYTAALPRIYRRELRTVTLYSINLAELMNLQAEVIWHTCIYQPMGFCGQGHILLRPYLLREGIATLLLLMSRYRLKDDGRGGKALAVVAIVGSGIVYHWTLDL